MLIALSLQILNVGVRTNTFMVVVTLSAPHPTQQDLKSQTKIVQTPPKCDLVGEFTVEGVFGNKEANDSSVADLQNILWAVFWQGK